MQGEHITQRLLPTIIRDICSSRGIQCQEFSDKWVLRLQKDGVRKWVVGYVFDINSSGSVQIASDKVASYLVLKHAGVPAIEHSLVRSRAIARYLGPPTGTANVVIKPLSSSGGIGVMPFATYGSAKQYVMSQPVGDYALSPRYDITAEYRYFVLDQQILLAYEKTNPQYNHGLPMFNLGQGAAAKITSVNSAFAVLAINAAAAIGLRLCAVDIVATSNGINKIMEINSGFMMEHFARQSDENYQLACQLYSKIIDAMMDT